MAQPPRSRRAFLGAAAAAAAAPVAFAVTGQQPDSSVAAGHSAEPGRSPAPGRPAAAAGGAEPGRFPEPGRLPGPPARRRKVAENSLPGDPRWAIRHLGAPAAITGYPGSASLLAGEAVPLFVSTTSRWFRVRAFRMGWYRGDLARLVWESGPVRGGRQRRYSVERPTSTVSTDWHPSLSVSTHDWPDGSYLLRLDADDGAQRFVPLTIRSARTAGRVVIKNSVATWQAYNTWGGYDLYHGPAGPADYASRSLAVSLDRPYDLDGAFMFLAHERKLIQLAEKLGVPLAYATSMDLAADPRLLAGASALISLGHDEYWSPPERANVTAARDAGVNLAFLGANAMFRRTRLAPTRLGDGRLVICYKTSYPRDPMYGRDNALVTSDWREPPHPDAESSVTGTLYESNPTSASFVVASPDAWLFRGTGAERGTRLRGLVGIEYDRVNPGWPVQRPIEVLAHSPLSCRGVHSYADAAYYTHAGGAGVFSTGTMRWVRSFTGNIGYGIDQRTARFARRVTANVLRAFADGPAAAAYPARDNLPDFREWPGDPIAAGHSLW